MADLSVSVMVLQRKGTIVCVETYKTAHFKPLFYVIRGLIGAESCGCVCVSPSVVSSCPYYKGNLFDSKLTISRARGVAEWRSAPLGQVFDSHHKSKQHNPYI